MFAWRWQMLQRDLLAGQELADPMRASALLEENLWQDEALVAKKGACIGQGCQQKQ